MCFQSMVTFLILQAVLCADKSLLQYETLSMLCKQCKIPLVAVETIGFSGRMFVDVIPEHVLLLPT
jgi:molybdopterin/thiamine biosynthesis adenylyltransferase